jgi:ATP synthase protein I
MSQTEGDRTGDPGMRERLDKLSNELAAKRPQADVPAGAGPSARDPQAMAASAMALGFRGATEVVVSVLVGAFIGWQLDAWLGTDPFLLIAFFFAGTAAGFMGLMRLVSRVSPKGPPGDQGQ